MCKKSLTGGQVSDVAYIDEAAFRCRELTRMKSRGPGDTENAMRQIESDYGIGFYVTWQLRYRRSRIRSLAWDVVERIKAAHAAECQRQLNKLKQQAERTKAARGADHPLVVATEALVRREEAPEGVPGGISETSD